MRQNKRRPVDAGDNVCHREGLAGAGDAEQHLFVYSVLNACHKAVYRFRLVAGRLIRRHELESIHSCLQNQNISSNNILYHKYAPRSI